MSRWPADAGVLGHVHDPEPPVRGPHAATVEPVVPLRPEVLARAALALADGGTARGRLHVRQPRRRLVAHLVTRLPGAQAVVDILESHREVLVEAADPVERVAADVHARTGDRERGVTHGGRPVLRRLEAVAMVEPLRRPEVPVRAGGLDAAVRIEQHRPHDSCAVLRVRGVLERLEPCPMTDDVVVEDDNVVARRRADDAAVHAGRVAAVFVREDDLGAGQPAQALLVARLAAVVHHDDAHAALRHGPAQAADGVDRRGRIAVGGHHDRHGPSLASVPVAHAPVLDPEAEAVADPSLHAHEPERRAQRSRDELPPAVVLDRQVRAPGQVVQERAPAGALRELRAAHQARPSSDSAPRSRGGRRSARAPSAAPSARIR